MTGASTGSNDEFIQFVVLALLPSKTDQLMIECCGVEAGAMAPRPRDFQRPLGRSQPAKNKIGRRAQVKPIEIDGRPWAVAVWFDHGGAGAGQSSVKGNAIA